MKTSRRPFIALVLALILAVTGQSMAIARGASAATGQMVLCVGTTTMTVYVDENGQPTSAAHLCPDCAFAGMLAVAATRQPFSAPMGYSYVAQTCFDTATLGEKAALAYAPRAPPLTV